MRDIGQLFSFLLRFTREVRYSRLTIAIVALTGAVGGIASTSMLALITRILTQQQSQQVWKLIWLFAALCLLLPFVRFVSQILLINLTQKALLRLRLLLVRRILAAPLRHLEQLGPHRLLATLTNDIGVIVESLGVLPLMVMHLAVVVTCLIYLGMLSGLVLLQIAAFIVIGVISYQLPIIRAIGHFTRARRTFDELTRQIRALTEGTKELKMNRARRHAFVEEVEESTQQQLEQARAGQVVFTAASSWGQSLFFFVLGLLVLVLPQLQPMPQQVLVGFTVLLFQLMVPLEVLMTTLPGLGRASVAAANVERLGFSLSSEGQEQEAPKGTPLEVRWDRLELDGVTHSYRRENEDETFLLGPIDITFRPGELVFLVGGNGSGKTTLAKLILGLYGPESGEVRFAGKTIDDANREQYREHFAAVFSDFFVFERLLGLQATALDDEARGYLRKLHLEQKVQVQDGVLSTIDLSQGQRKRLALLTAYLEDRPIYLFDEWAADQDPLFKEIFYLELLPQLRSRGKTVIVISHDDHYYQVADRILKLDYGKIEADLPASEYLGRKSLAARAVS